PDRERICRVEQLAETRTRARETCQTHARRSRAVVRPRRDEGQPRQTGGGVARAQARARTQRPTPPDQSQLARPARRHARGPALQRDAVLAGISKTRPAQVAGQTRSPDPRWRNFGTSNLRIRLETSLPRREASSIFPLLKPWISLQRMKKAQAQKTEIAPAPPATETSAATEAVVPV